MKWIEKVRIDMKMRNLLKNQSNFSQMVGTNHDKVIYHMFRKSKRALDPTIF